MTDPTHIPRRGEKLRLPSGNLVVVLKPSPGAVIDCGYLRDGSLIPEGHGMRGRVAFRIDFLRCYGRPA